MFIEWDSLVVWTVHSPKRETVAEVEWIKRLEEKSRHCVGKSPLVLAALVRLSWIFQRSISHGFQIEDCTPFGWISDCKCMAPVLLDHGDVPKSDAAKSWSCSIRLSLRRVSSTFLRRILRNNQQTKFLARPETKFLIRTKQIEPYQNHTRTTTMTLDETTVNISSSI